MSFRSRVSPASLVRLILLPAALLLLFGAYLLPAAVTRLEQATARQCLARDWPSHQEQAHLAFCAREGYAVGPAR